MTTTTAPSGVDQLARYLGCLVALLVTDPTAWAGRPTVDLVLPLAAGLAAWFAATPLTARPVALGFRWRNRLSRHRNTAFAVMCVVLAAFNPPPGWLAACDTALLLTYLLCVDALAAGPPAARLLRRPLVLLCAYGASAVALTAALLPVAPTGPWARLLAALALAGAAAAVIAALTPRRRP
ncbi:hypothetical protein ACEZCY_09080 [Streptacidiphilus sp. N1-12]|uniref:Uncharacterized protein n=2 Tax=Streptacidiphilus alkalitolerans TaxID=3342712 RepID=A0ABV6WVJ4_9ACTN